MSCVRRRRWSPASWDLTLRSVSQQAGVSKLVFPAYDFYGKTDDLDWAATLAKEGFRNGESAIVVTGRYQYGPMMGLLDKITVSWTYSVAVNPNFSREYKYISGDADWNYYNVK